MPRQNYDLDLVKYCPGREFGSFRHNKAERLIRWVWIFRVLHQMFRGPQGSEATTCILDKHVRRVHNRLGAPHEMEIEEAVPSCWQADGPCHEPRLQLILIVVVCLRRRSLHVIPKRQNRL